MTPEQKKDLAESYRMMMNLSAWKHFMASVEAIEDMAIKDEDSIDVENLDRSIGRIGECRGKRWAIKKIRTDLDYILNGLQ